MGMFDYYEPDPQISCPKCGVILIEWQGKAGPNGLFVWHQGKLAPVDQRVDDDLKVPQARLTSFRLPEEFEFYSDDCRLHTVLARGKTLNGLWSQTKIIEVDKYSNPWGEA